MVRRLPLTLGHSSRFLSVHTRAGIFMFNFMIMERRTRSRRSFFSVAVKHSHGTIITIIAMGFCSLIQYQVVKVRSTQGLLHHRFLIRQSVARHGFRQALAEVQTDTRSHSKLKHRRPATADLILSLLGLLDRLRLPQTRDI